MYYYYYYYQMSLQVHGRGYNVIIKNLRDFSNKMMEFIYTYENSDDYQHNLYVCIDHVNVI